MIRSVECLGDRWKVKLYEILRCVLRWERRNYPNFVRVAVSSEHSISIQEKKSWHYNR